MVAQPGGQRRLGPDGSQIGQNSYLRMFQAPDQWLQLFFSLFPYESARPDRACGRQRHQLDSQFHSDESVVRPRTISGERTPVGGLPPCQSLVG